MSPATISTGVSLLNVAYQGSGPSPLCTVHQPLGYEAEGLKTSSCCWSGLRMRMTGCRGSQGTLQPAAHRACVMCRGSPGLAR